MKKITLLSLLFLYAVLTSQAIIISKTETGFSDVSGPNPPADFSLTLDTTPYTNIDGSGMFVTITTFGDFDFIEEDVQIIFEGSSMGTLWDNNTAGDLFDSGSDVGNQYLSAQVATFTVNELAAEGFLADGQIVFSFVNFGPEVDNLNDNPNEYISASVEFTPVPEASSYALIAGISGLAVVLVRRRSK